jgi:aspartyl protease family protein
MRRAHGLLAAAALLASGPALAQSGFVPVLAAPASAPPATQPVTSHRVALTGSMGSRQALLVIDRAAPRVLSVGESWRGVRLLSVSSSEAVVEVDGERHTLRVGAAAVSLGGAPSPGGGRVIKLSGDTNGHFMANGQINGKSVTLLVDTGASLVSMGQPDADRLGIAYRDAPRVGLRTANGDVQAFRVMLNSVRVADVDVYNVEAVIQPQPMPFVLLGNSFLKRFSLKLENDVLTLERR